MSIISDIEDKVKSWRGYGITFGISPDDYTCDDDDVVFGKNQTNQSGGVTINYQPIIFHGKQVGWLKERQKYNIFYPIMTSFMAFIPDDEVIDSPHYIEDEYNWMSFSNLQDFVDYINSRYDYYNHIYEDELGNFKEFKK